MIITEFYTTREDGVRLVRTFSDNDVLIRQDVTEALYDEAIDPEDSGRTYTETDIPIEDNSTAEELLNIILGVQNDN